MLVLSRRPHQTILIPDVGVTLRVLSIKGNVVRIGIEAPPEVNVVREELHTEARDPAPRSRLPQE